MNKIPFADPNTVMVRCKSKQIARMFNSAEHKYVEECNLAVRNIIPAVVIAMYENSQVKWPGVIRWNKVMFDEVKRLNLAAQETIFQVLENETGMELQIGDGTSWRDQPFANYEKHMQVMESAQKNPNKWIIYFQKKSRWCTASIMGCCLLACHRQFGWSPEGKLNVIREAAEDIMDWYNRKPKAVESEFERVTGHKAEELYSIYIKESNK